MCDIRIHTRIQESNVILQYVYIMSTRTSLILAVLCMIYQSSLKKLSVGYKLIILIFI